MKRAILPGCVLIVVVVVVFALTKDFAFCGLLLLTGFLAIACYVVRTGFNSMLLLKELEHNLHTTGTVNMKQTLKGYKLEKVSELETFKPVINYFNTFIRKHDSDDYLRDMNKSLIFAAIFYIFTTLGYIISFIAEAKAQGAAHVSKSFYGYLYVMAIAFYTAYYLAPIILFQKKNSTAVSDAKH